MSDVATHVPGNLVGQSDSATGRGDVRRAHLVATARRLLSRNGVTATSIKDIAHAAGVAPGLVHYYFASKEVLLVAVAAQLEGELRATWRNGAEHARHIEDPLECLVAALDNVAAEADQHPERRRLLLDLALLSLTTPLLHDRLGQLWREVTSEIENALRPVLGQLPAYTLASPREVADVLNAAIDGIVVGALMRGESPRAAFKALSVMLLSLVATAYITSGQEPPLQHLREIAQQRGDAEQR